MADQDKRQDTSVREAGEKGGQRVRELVEEGKQTERSGSGNNRQDQQKK